MTDRSPRQLLDEGDRTAAKLAAEARLATKKQDVEALATLAKLALEAGDVQAAERLVASAAHRDRADYDLGLVSAMLLAQAGEADQARLKYAELTGQAPDRGEAWFGLGFQLLGKELIADALVPLQKATRCSPGNWAAHFYLGAALGAEGQLQSALVSLKQAWLLNPGHAPIALAISTALLDLGLAEEAEAVLEEALDRQPTNVALLLQLSNVFVARDNLPDAMAAAKRAVELDPENPGALADLARLLLAHGLQDEALALCADTERRGLGTAQLSIVRAMSLEAKATPDLPGAAQAYRQAMTQDATGWSAANNLGLLLMELSEQDASLLAEARDVLEKAIARGPDRVEPKLNLAILLAREGQKTKARELARVVAETAQHAGYREQAQQLMQSLA